VAKTFPVKSVVEGVASFSEPLAPIVRGLKMGQAVKILEATEYLSNQQLRWWKGILLRKVADHTGDSVEYWETKLKTAVMPDEFQLYYVPLGKQVIGIVPSVTKLSVKKMNILMEGSVKHLREGVDEKGNSLYGDEFQWVTMPIEELRK